MTIIEHELEKREESSTVSQTRDAVNDRASSTSEPDSSSDEVYVFTSDEERGASESSESPGFFEGPEKTLEVCFRPGVGPKNGLRCLHRKQLDVLCTKAKCTIISSISSNYMDAYVLSESSLFIYPYRYIMKTCGTTTLLRALNTLLVFADKLGMELTWVCYSRKNLTRPLAQLYPHSNFDDEISFISSHEKLQSRLRGSGHILGPVTGDHWFVYVADHSAKIAPSMVPVSNITNSTETLTINMMMFDLAPSVCQQFFLKNNATAQDMTMKSGIANLVPGATIDACAFEPCGYSMNAILHDAYSTVHITPEETFSYASFETNTYHKNYSPMLRNVMNVFKPKRFVVTMFADDVAYENQVEVPMQSHTIAVPGLGVYSRTSVSSTKVEIDVTCIMAVFTLDADKNLAEEVVTPRQRGYSFS